MVTLCYSGKSRVSAENIAEASGGEIEAVRRSSGSINWGRAGADTVLNSDTSVCVNKRKMRELFDGAGVPIPMLLDYEHILEQPSLHTWPIVGRPDKHMKGRGYWLCNNVVDIRRALSGTRSKAAATHFMEYIPNAIEYRVHVFLGKSIRISQKDFDGRTGCHQDYTTIKPTLDRETRRNVRRAAKKAVKALSLDFGAVDILVNDRGVYVLEVNSAPGLGGSMPRLYAEKILEWYAAQ